MKNLILATITLMLLSGGDQSALSAAENGKTVLKGQSALGDWKNDRPGLRRLIRPQDLPAIGRSAGSFPEVVPLPPGAKPSVPPRFSVELVKSGLTNPRAIRTAPNGDLFVADSKAHTVRVFQVPAGSAKPANESVFASDLYQPYGIAFYPPGPNPEWIYIANSDGSSATPTRMAT